MKYLVVGLGNIGDEYKNTRHNIGFRILDALSRASNIVFKTERYGDVSHFKFKGRNIVLLKPSTYMNLSGKAVNYWLQKEKIPVDKLLILVDDLSLPFGTLRMKGKGSDGGHNGLKNINSILGHNKYARIRFGIGNEFNKGQQVDYVLGKWTDEENQDIDSLISKCIEGIEMFSTIGLERTMNSFNTKAK